MLQNVGKKDPPEKRVELLQKLKDVVTNNFREIEPWIIPRLLPVLLGRLDDKPQVMEEVLDLGKIIIQQLNVQTFKLALDIVVSNLNENSKWRVKLGSLKLLSDLIVRLESLDRDLLSYSSIFNTRCFRFII